jgi:putative oxidoreductase
MFNRTDWGLLISRMGFGLSMFFFHGLGKLTGGTEMWRQLGSNMPSFGMDGLGLFWGLMAALAESVAALCMALGIAYPIAPLVLAFNMAVAVMVHVQMPPGPMAGWKGASHALLYFIAAISLSVSGPGKYVLKSGK